MTAEEQRIALDEEASSLPIHVRMCAMRHYQIISKVEELDRSARSNLEKLQAAAKVTLDAQDKRLSRIEKAAWAILLTLAGGGAVTVAQVQPVLQALAGQP
jgi:hypothetical protein